MGKKVAKTVTKTDVDPVGQAEKVVREIHDALDFVRGRFEQLIDLEKKTESDDYQAVISELDGYESKMLYDYCAEEYGSVGGIALIREPAIGKDMMFITGFDSDLNVLWTRVDTKISE